MTSVVPGPVRIFLFVSGYSVDCGIARFLSRGDGGTLVRPVKFACPGLLRPDPVCLPLWPGPERQDVELASTEAFAPALRNEAIALDQICLGRRILLQHPDKARVDVINGRNGQRLAAGIDRVDYTLAREG